jgi:hypothetical protein
MRPQIIIKVTLVIASFVMFCFGVHYLSGINTSLQTISGTIQEWETNGTAD